MNEAAETRAGADPAPKPGDGGPAPDRNGEPADKKWPVLSKWSVLTLGVAVGGIVVATLIVLSLGDEENATTTLGVIIPGIVALGSAAFGITYAGDEAKKRGQAEKGRDQAEKGKQDEKQKRHRAEEAKEDERRKRKEIAKEVDVAAPAFEALRKLMASPAGKDSFQLRALLDEADLRAFRAEDRPGGGAGVAPEIEVLELDAEQVAAAGRAVALAREALQE